jgi:phosphoribosylaminoimidazolecarboxamide formyltransferase / IMP cyclohydrolase
MKRALFSVTDKTGLEEFGKELQRIFPKLEMLASGGTAKMFASAGISCTPISQQTQFPECFGGRVKTLHPAILGGILQRRGVDDEEAAGLGIAPIDLVVCNLYLFDSNKKMEELAESMDIGGSTMIRAACKNFSSVGVIVDPNDYPAVLEELRANQKLSRETRVRLAVKAMRMSAEYEARIAEALAEQAGHRWIPLENERKLSYGENPDQEAWVYSFDKEEGIASANVLGGKPLSYNNYEDASQSFFAMQRIFDQNAAAAAIVKHGGLCGLATGKDLRAAFQRAWDGDSKSAFGSVIALSQEVDESFGEVLKSHFIEVVLAPAFSPGFLAWTSYAKPSLRLLQVRFDAEASRLYRGISGGLLVQTSKKELYPQSKTWLQPMGSDKIGVATKRLPQIGQENLFRFCLAAVQSVKSNAIVLVREYEPSLYQLIGVGGGQPNRIDSLQRLALPKAIEILKHENCKDVRKALGEIVLASDGFFPFADSIQAAADAGIQIFLQPGGSVRDPEVIEEADKRGLCMIFTGQRYFSH